MRLTVFLPPEYVQRFATKEAVEFSGDKEDGDKDDEMSDVDMSDDA